MNIKKFLPLAFIGLFITNAFADCTSCDVTYVGIGSNLSVGNGETLCIKSGSFNGSVNLNGQNITICVSNGATFNVNNLSFKTGTKVFNYGTMTINGSTIDGASSIENSGTLNITGNMNMNNDLNITNNKASTINYSSNLELKRQSQFLNYGTVNVNAEFNSENNTSFFNNGHLKIQQHFNPNGLFVNNGFVLAQGFINVNPSSNVTNNCTFYSNSGFNNNSNNVFTNNGFIRADGPVQLNGNSSFQQNSQGLLIGTTLINNTRVIGSGNYYFTGETRNQGPFGQDAQGINFYDVTNSTENIFDIENQVPHSSVTKNAIAKEDTSLVNKGCSDNFPIPVATDILYRSEINKVVYVPLQEIAWDEKVGLDFTATNLLSFNNILRNTAVSVAKVGLQNTFVDEGKGTYYFYPEEEIIEFHPELNYTGTSQIDYFVKNTLGYRSNLASVTIIIEPSVLPVELISFNGIMNGQKAELTWATASEKNNDYFQVERSLDGIQFEKVGIVNGNGNSNTPINYQFTDKQAAVGVNYYRLLQVDYDGQFEYSKIIALENKSLANNQVTIFPNPTSDVLNIQSDSKIESYTIMNATGAIVKGENSNTLNSRVAISVSDMSSGLYTVNINFADQTQQTLKFIKK